MSADRIFQVSSGSSGDGVKIVQRSLADIRSIHQIVLNTWLKLYPEPPKRVALLGGISHGQAARKLQIDGTRFESFELGDWEKLSRFDPDFLSCYPSIARALIVRDDLKLPSLKALKLGGEPVFQSDIEKIQSRFSQIPVIEQLGSTEMPAVAIGIYRFAGDPRRLELQTHRFEFALEKHGDWQPLRVKDRFGRSIRPPRGYYDTGDEVIVKDGCVAAIRRRNDPAWPFHRDLEDLFYLGCNQVQLDLDRCELRYEGTVHLPTEILVGGFPFRTLSLPPLRLPHSNKMPLALFGQKIRDSSIFRLATRGS